MGKGSLTIEASRAPLGAERHAGAALLGSWLLVTAAWWALALVPVAEPPPWLELARSVCFGSTPSGLPDTYGWVVLVVGPLSMLAGILGAWGGDIAAAFAEAMRSAGGRAVLATTACLVLAGISWTSLRIASGLEIERMSYAPDRFGPLPEAYPRLSTTMPALALVDQHQAPFTEGSFHGQPTVLTFAFAHCHTICPVIVDTTRRAAAELGEDKASLVIVTLDPWRDTPGRLASMHEAWKLPASARVLSGSVDQVTAALDALNVGYTRDETSGEVAHPPLVYVVDASGRIAYAFNNPPVDWLVAAVSRLAPQ